MKHLALRNNLIALVITTASLFIFESKLTADDLILVRTNGMIISGDLDSQSDLHQITIVKKTPQIILRTSHHWDEFQSITHRGKPVSRDELLAIAQHLKVIDSKRNFDAEAMQFWFAPKPYFPSRFPRINLESNRIHDINSAISSNRVAALYLDAYLANWDRDAELDGLMVHVSPINNRGEIVPVDGQVELRLIGQRFRELNAMNRNNREKFPELEQWNRLIRKSDFGPHGAIVKLEFRRIRPELRPEIAQTALMTGSLSVAGQGRFDASAVDVIIRPPSRFRDEHYLRAPNRSRVHPHENYPRP